MNTTFQFPLDLHPDIFPQYGLSIFHLIYQTTVYFIYSTI